MIPAAGSEGSWPLANFSRSGIPSVSDADLENVLHIRKPHEDLEDTVHLEGPHPFLQCKLPQFGNATPLPDGILDRRGGEHQLVNGDTPLVAAPPALFAAILHHELGLFIGGKEVRRT